MSFYWRFRVLLLVLALVSGGGIAVWRGALDFQAARSETAPTAVSLDSFDSYRGQRWLKVENGVFVTDRVVIVDAPRDVGAPQQVFFYLPMVPRGWKPGDPVHVICKFGPGPRESVAGWLRENGGVRSFTGVVANEPPGVHFPGLGVTEPAILLREGPPEGPEVSAGTIALGAVMILGGLGLGAWLVLGRRSASR